MNRLFQGCTIALILLLLTSCSSAAPLMPTFTPHPSTTPTSEPILPKGLIENVAYADDSPKQTVSLHLPEGRDPSAPVLFLPFGRYFPELVTYFSERGYPVISVSVRNDTFQHEMEDSFCALAFIQAESEAYGLASDRIVPLGGSMGGGSAALLAAIDDPSQFMTDCGYAFPEHKRSAAVISLAGVFDYALEDDFFHGFIRNITNYMEGTPTENPETWEIASAINHIDGTEPAFLLLHGTADVNVSQHQSEVFADDLDAKGVEVELVLLSGLDHTGIVKSEQAFILMETFLSDVFR